ncbi:hypothetical protein ES703_102122 [subsurface metagenome]
MPTERVTIYIDGSNLYHSLKAGFSRTDLDFEKFCNKLLGGRHLVRIYYYNVPLDQTKEPERYKDQQKFFLGMRRLPYLEMRLGRLIYRNWPDEPPYEKGLDVKLATDILVHGFQDNYNVIIIVSSDSDFADALQAIKDRGKHVEIALFGQAWTGQHLRDVADKVITLNADFLSQCWK